MLSDRIRTCPHELDRGRIIAAEAVHGNKKRCLVQLGLAGCG
jgi:hypothetical protein